LKVLVRIQDSFADSEDFPPYKGFLPASLLVSQPHLAIPYAFVTEVDKFQVSEPVFDHVSEPVQKPVQKYR